MRQFGTIILDGVFQKFGWLLLGAGLVLPVLQVYDALTCEPATARIVKTGVTCKAKRCVLGHCSRETVNCDAAVSLEALGSEIKRTRRVRIAFTTKDGQAVEVWAAASKLNLTTAVVGDDIAIQYRRTYPQYVTSPILYRHMAIGVGLFLVGALLLVLRRIFKSKEEALSGVAVLPWVDATLPEMEEMEETRPAGTARSSTVSTPRGLWSMPGTGRR